MFTTSSNDVNNDHFITGNLSALTWQIFKMRNIIELYILKRN